MPRKQFSRWIPSPQYIKRIPGLSRFGYLVDDANLFHINRHSTSKAVFIGLFVGMIPFPIGQIVLAAFLAIKVRSNLPLTVSLVWISNPLTIPFIYYAQYRLGCSILLIEPVLLSIELSWAWLEQNIALIGLPLLVGSLLSGLLLALCGYLGVLGLWRWHASQRWRNRLRRK